jgi:hypothetical protein
MRSPSLVNCLSGVERLSESECYVMTDGQSVSLSWNKTLVWGVRLHFYYCQTVAGLLMWSALSDERTSLLFNFCWPSPAQPLSGSSPEGLITMFYSLRFEASFFIASYDLEVFDPASTRDVSGVRSGDNI